MMVSSDKVKVAVRVRPFSRREIELGSKCVIDMDGTQTLLYNPMMAFKENESASNLSSKTNFKTFAFDHCFWSLSDDNPKYASQENVFDCLGIDILTRAFEGYNACIFAYGQTGSGKSYSMMGTLDQRGIIPRLCDSLFEMIKAKSDHETCFKVEVSYLEIYNEKVRDLLDPIGRHNLKVREHGILGCYVDGLSTLAVSSFKDIDNLMNEGNKSRTVAATNMNSESSRSHAVFNIMLTQTLTDLQTNVSGEKVSKISLIDLAGSERAQKTGAVGERLKEGSNINKSLTTLGLVISTLADQVSGKNKTKFVPYRDSILTWLLKDNLGGNSKTVMIATLSPSADNYEETLSTLRYADRAKRIVNHAIVNEDPNARIIRELREEVDMLRKMLSQAKLNMKPVDIQERLEESEKLMREMGKTWEEKLSETEIMHQERQAALEKMGISVEKSGIKVQQGRHYLVNLNADPSLNELLVYYLKKTTLIGRPEADPPQDIQLFGLGIMTEHCVITIDQPDVFIIPLPNARTCINGKKITCKTKVKHGDRIVWGNNHFFRLNCPKTSPSTETPDNIDFDFAQQELTLQQMGDDPIQEAINNIEKQHEEDKQEALERQRIMYEHQMQRLRTQLMSPGTPSHSILTPTSTHFTFHPKYQIWTKDREKLFRQSLSKLKEEVVRANTMVCEANCITQELNKPVEFSVTLQIPASNLSPNRRRGAFVSEPAILVKHKGRQSQVWSIEKLENKIIDMRDYYDEFKDKQLTPEDSSSRYDPFTCTQANQQLIGVANVFLEVLFYDAMLDYQVPIISQQGEVAGRLHVQICRLATSRSVDDSASDSGLDMCLAPEFEEEYRLTLASNVICQVSIKGAKGLPPSISNMVMCQYAFWGHPETIVVQPTPTLENNSILSLENISISFDHTKEYMVNVTEEFLEHCAEGALSIEVWGHRRSDLKNVTDWDLNHLHAKSRSMVDRWSELTRKIELWVEIHELNDNGEYSPVEVSHRNNEVHTGGIHQLRQGHTRRILATIKPVIDSGTLPIVCESIVQLSVGGVCARSKLQKGLDSYQEEDLATLRDRWSDALEKRRRYLDQQLQRLLSKDASEKTESDREREQSLIDQWVCLTEERNAVLVPAVASGIPGAPAEWKHHDSMEQHIPVIFLDLNAEDMSTPTSKEGSQAAGANSILPKEHGTKFFNLPFVKSMDNEISVLASWDSSVHDSIYLNRVTPTNERVYMILKAVIQLSHPAAMQLVLRKRICINIYKKQSFTDKIKKRIGRLDLVFASGVTYEVVSNIPKASEDLEDRESLAQMAASHNDQNMSDGETYIEKYIRGVSAVESILALDRLRQDVTLKEILSVKGRPLRKAMSAPNIQNVLASPILLDQIRSDIELPSSRELDYLSTLPKHLMDTGKDLHICKNSTYGPSMNKNSQLNSSSKTLKPLQTLVEETRCNNNTIVENDEDEEASAFQSFSLHNEKSSQISNSLLPENFHINEECQENISLQNGDGASGNRTPDLVGECLSGEVTPVNSLANKENDDIILNNVDKGCENMPNDNNSLLYEKPNDPIISPMYSLEGDDTTSMCSFGSRADLYRLGCEPLPEWMVIDEPVNLLFSRGASKTGFIRYVGKTEFATGNWIGVELDTPDGKNDGYVKGVRYFRCRPNYGIFVRQDKLIQDKKRRQVNRVPANLRRSTGNLSANNINHMIAKEDKTMSTSMRQASVGSYRNK